MGGIGRKKPQEVLRLVKQLKFENDDSRVPSASIVTTAGTKMFWWNYSDYGVDFGWNIIPGVFGIAVSFW